MLQVVVGVVMVTVLVETVVRVVDQVRRASPRRGLVQERRVKVITVVRERPTTELTPPEVVVVLVLSVVMVYRGVLPALVVPV
jgi:hypothetical protein